MKLSYGKRIATTTKIIEILLKRLGWAEEPE